MPKPTLEITFNNDGTMEGDAIGFKGRACEKATRIMDDYLQKKTVKRKPEYYQSEATSVRQKTRN